MQPGEAGHVTPKTTRITAIPPATSSRYPPGTAYFVRLEDPRAHDVARRAPGRAGMRVDCANAAYFTPQKGFDATPRGHAKTAPVVHACCARPGETPGRKRGSQQGQCQQVDLVGNLARADCANTPGGRRSPHITWRYRVVEHKVGRNERPSGPRGARARPPRPERVRRREADLRREAADPSDRQDGRNYTTEIAGDRVACGRRRLAAESAHPTLSTQLPCPAAHGHSMGILSRP